MTPSDSKPTMQLPKKSELKFDANESPFNSPMNRYPDATAATLRESWGRHETYFLLRVYTFAMELKKRLTM